MKIYRLSFNTFCFINSFIFERTLNKKFIEKLICFLKKKAAESTL